MLYLAHRYTQVPYSISTMNWYGYQSLHIYELFFLCILYRNLSYWNRDSFVAIGMGCGNSISACIGKVTSNPLKTPKWWEPRALDEPILWKPSIFQSTDVRIRQREIQYRKRVFKILENPMFLSVSMMLRFYLKRWR